MELEFDRDTIISYQTVAETTLCQEETLECIVPDACPDILRIVDVCGQAMLGRKQAGAGLAVISGMVRATLLYQPEGGGGLRRMEVSLPFTCQAEASGLTERGIVLAYPRLRSAEARALNPRKVLIRVDLAVEISACQPSEQSICCSVSNPEEGAVCQKQVRDEHYKLLSVQEKPFTFSDRIRLQSVQGENSQMLASRVQAFCTESNLIGNKLIFKGTAELSILTQDSSGALVSNRESLPFSQIMEVVGAGEECDCQVQVEVTDLQCMPVSDDDRSLEISLELLAQAKLYCHQPMTLLQDLYSTSWRTDVDREELELRHLEDRSIRPQTVRELLETDGVVRSVIDSRLTLGQIDYSRDGNDMVPTVEAWLSILYLDENELVQCARKLLTVTGRVPCPPTVQCACRCVCPDEIFAASAAGGIEVRFNVEFHCLTTSTTRVQTVHSARFGEARGCKEGERPSIVLRLASPGESLWEIAKAYGTTTDQILQANELEADTPPTGRMLLIPSLR